MGYSIPLQITREIPLVMLDWPMGLLYQMPVSNDEGDRTTINKSGLTLKSYGLPYIFWGYLAAAWAVASMLYLAINATAMTMIKSDDQLNQVLAIIVLIVLFAIPIFFTCFYFFEVVWIKNEQKLIVKKKLFFTTISTKLISLQSKDSLSVEHFLDSANYARLHKHPDLKSFQNKGYFELYAIDKDNKKIKLDRHSRKADLVKIKKLLSSH